MLVQNALECTNLNIKYADPIFQSLAINFGHLQVTNNSPVENILQPRTGRNDVAADHILLLYKCEKVF